MQDFGRSEKLLVSIVIDNYNYGRFLRQAIDSALNQTYPHIEVVVVDDGSTDNSREIISSYADRIIPILKENGGQASALNVGFARSSGDIVLFLDADDFLLPSALERVASVWRPGLAKVQCRVGFVGDASEGLGTTFPPAEVLLPSGDLRRMLLERGSYPSPPMSGNAFARPVLTSILPVPEEEYRLCADGYLVTLAPFYGDVVSIDEALAAYRLHGGNRYSRGPGDLENLGLYVKHELQKLELLASRAAALGKDVPEELPLRDFHLLVQRFVSLRLAPNKHPVRTDRRWQVAYWGMRALWRWSGKPWGKRIGWTVWLAFAGFMPRRMLRKLYASQ